VIKTVPGSGSPGENVILLHKKAGELALGDTTHYKEKKMWTKELGNKQKQLLIELRAQK
jgi:hypothetical protein